MLERVSPLAGVSPVVRNGISIAEAGGFKLTQIAGDASALRKALGADLTANMAAPTKFGTAMLTAPAQVWLTGDVLPETEHLVTTPLSSSRCRIALEGKHARDVLAKSAAIDFHPSEFGKDRFAMTGMHHMPVLVHCTGTDTFHIYAMRTFALSLWQVLEDSAIRLG